VPVKIQIVLDLALNFRFIFHSMHRHHHHHRCCRRCCCYCHYLKQQRPWFYPIAVLAFTSSIVIITKVHLSKFGWLECVASRIPQSQGLSCLPLQFEECFEFEFYPLNFLTGSVMFFRSSWWLIDHKALISLQRFVLFLLFCWCYWWVACAYVLVTMCFYFYYYYYYNYYFWALGCKCYSGAYCVYLLRCLMIISRLRCQPPCLICFV